MINYGGKRTTPLGYKEDTRIRQGYDIAGMQALTHGLEQAAKGIAQGIEKRRELDLKLQDNLNKIRITSAQSKTWESIKNGNPVIEIEMNRDGSPKFLPTGQPSIQIREPGPLDIELARRDFDSREAIKMDMMRKKMEDTNRLFASITGSPVIGQNGLQYAPSGPTTQPHTFPKRGSFEPLSPSMQEILQAQVGGEIAEKALKDKYEFLNRSRLKEFEAEVDVDTSARKKKKEQELETDPAFLARKLKFETDKAMANDQIRRQFKIFETEYENDPELAKTKLAAKISETRALRELGLSPRELLAALTDTLKRRDDLLPSERKAFNISEELGKTIYFMKHGTLPPEQGNGSSPSGKPADRSNEIADEE
jgi:hypothetical protein